MEEIAGSKKYKVDSRELAHVFIPVFLSLEELRVFFTHHIAVRKPEVEKQDSFRRPKNIVSSKTEQQHSLTSGADTFGKE